MNKGVNFLRRPNSKNVLFALIINFVFMGVVLLLFPMQYDMPDTVGYPKYIVMGEYSFGIISWFFCYLCGALQKIIFPVNAFVVIQVALSYLSFVELSYVFLQKYNKKIAILMILFINSFYAVFQYVNISFTIYPSFLGITGIVYIIHFTKREKWILGSVIGVLNIAVCSLYRFSVLESVLFMGVFYVIGMSVSEFFCMKKSQRKAKDFFSILFERKRLLCFLCAVVICFSLNYISNSINTSTESLKYYREYTSTRATVWDYKIPEFNLCAEEYEAIGLDKNDLKMLELGYMDDEGATTLDNLKQIKKIRDKYQSNHADLFSILKSMVVTVPLNIRGFGERAVGYISVGFVCVVFLLFLKKKMYFIPTFLALAVFALSFYLWYNGRTPYRTVHALWLSSLVFLMYSFPVNKEEYRKRFISLLNRKSVAICLAVGLSLFMIGGLYYSQKASFTIESFSNNDTSHKLKEYIKKNNEKKVYFFKACRYYAQRRQCSFRFKG